MSAQPIENTTYGPGPGSGQDDGPDNDLTAAPQQLEIRRNAVVSGVIGAAASAIAIAYLWRAVGTGAVLDWTLCVIMGAMATAFLRSLLDSRTPLLVADEMGVRIRFGAQWRGLPWEAIDQVVVKPQRGVLHDGRLVLSLHHVQRAIEGLEGRALRSARLNQKMYGAALAVPLGLTTRVTGDGPRDAELADRVAALSQGRAEVVTLLEPTTAAPDDVAEAEELEDAAPVEPPAPVDAPADAAVDVTVDDSEATEPLVIDDEELPAATRRPRWRRRNHTQPSVDEEPESDAAAIEMPTDEDDVPEPAVVQNRADERVERRGHTAQLRVIDAISPVTARDSRIRPIAKLGEPVAPLVIGDFEPEPAYNPVIGPELAAARTRVGLSVDELADRTRIRPHVIESIEVDDFTPCGGDFYARGHIRTLARVLGKDPAPMLAQFDARYATAPINARRVFEAELATGMTGSMRSTVGGPNWALLVGVVLALILVWSGVRLFAGDSQEMLETPPPVLNGSAGLGNVYGEPPTTAEPEPVPTTLTAVNAGTHIEVHDGDGALVFEGDLVIGEVKRLEVDPPITVTADNAGALSVMLGQQDMGFLGEPDQPGTEVFQRPEE